MDLGMLLAILVLSLLVPCLLAQEDNQTQNISCPKDFQCGKLGRLSFPFTNISQPADCGLCQVYCDNRPLPRIRLSWVSDQCFDVISVSQNSSIIKLKDPVLHDLLVTNSCNTFYYDIKLPDSPISFTSLLNITLYRCSIFPQLSQEVVDQFYSQGYKPYELCEGFTIYYRNPKYHHSQSEFYPLGCSAINLPMRPRNNVSKESEVFELLAGEFDLQWHLPNAGKNKLSMSLLIAAPACGVALIVILVFCFRRQLPFCNLLDFLRIKTEDHNIEAFLKNYGSLAPKRYHYSDVKKMTNSFNAKLGGGGYGSVYKGKLKDGSLVAVKVLEESKGNGEEFINEVASISRTSHVNIVTLLGFCFQGGKKALIYEFMPNGSLEKFIYGERSLMNRQLEWKTLYKIAVGIARGLEYLHRGCNTRILHFDIKPHNILLDGDFCPKISDFGLAKLCPGKESIISTLTARGTIGYIAPEVVCKSVGEVSHKSDVYSYGMVVLEMVGGRKNVDVGVDRSSEIYFPNWIYTRLDRGEELGLSGIMDEEENEKARKMLIVSLWCIQVHPSYRPTITNVLEMLEESLEALQMPPKPFFYSPSRTSSRGSTNVIT